MKRLSGLILAAILGSLITLGAYKGLGMDQKVVLQEQQDIPTVLTNAPLTTSPKANMTPPPPPVSRSASKALPVDFTAAAAKSMPAVVHIGSTINSAQAGGGQGDIYDLFGDLFGNPYGGGQGGARQSSGSGVIISRDGYIVTNNHVIEGASELEVTLYDNRSFPAELIGTDPSTDLAVIKVNTGNLPILELGNSDDTRVGEWVLAVGNPFNLSSTVTAGIVSAKGRNIDILNDQYAIESFIQTDAAVNPGNSGGALVNTNGDLVGINTAIATKTGYYQGYSFAVPVNIVQKVVDDLINYGAVQRAYLGVHIKDLDSKTARDMGLNISQGVYIAGLMDGGAAREAGIQEGDVIVAVDGKRVRNAPELQEAIGRKRPGDVASVTINRGGREQKVIVPLRTREGGIKMEGAQAGVDKNLMSRLGLRVQDLSATDKARLDVEGGVRVTEIMPGVVSKETEMQEGFVILKVNERPVRSNRDFQNALKSKRGGVMVEGIYPGDPTVYFYAFGL